MIFSIQRYLEDYFHRRGLQDPDQYAVSLAHLYDGERSGKNPAEFLRAMKRMRTAFYRTNANLAREKFSRDLLALLDTKFKKKRYSSSQPQSQRELKRPEAA